MAEGGSLDIDIQSKTTKEGFVTSPVISPLVRQLNSDQLMTIAEDEELFSQVLNQMTKHQECGDICNISSPNKVEFFSHSTPIRPVTMKSMEKTRGTAFESRGTSFIPLEVPNEEVLSHKKYLMVLIVIDNCFLSDTN